MAYTKDTVKIPSFEPGIHLDVWVYRPSGKGPFPVVIAGHGWVNKYLLLVESPYPRCRDRLTVIKEAGLATFAEHWATAGWASLVFDYRGFGASESHPRDRNVVVLKRQVEDYQSVIKWAKSSDERYSFNESKVVVMGSALGGLSVAELVIHADREGIAGGMVHCPVLDGNLSYSAAEHNLNCR